MDDGYGRAIGFYYLNSRYYNPEWGRFINADTTDILALSGTLTDKNLFAYCDNNPVMRVDEDGEFWNIIAGAVIGAVINVGVSFVTAKILGEEYTWKDAIVDGVSGAIVGALASTGLGAVGQAIGGAIVGGASSVVSDLIHGEEINWIKAVNSAAAGGIAGYIGGSGLRANPGVKKADKTCLKVLDKVTSNRYATARGAKSVMTQAINRLNKVLVPATIKTTAMYSGASFLNSILMRSYNRVNS